MSLVGVTEQYSIGLFPKDGCEDTDINDILDTQSQAYLSDLILVVINGGSASFSFIKYQYISNLITVF